MTSRSLPRTHPCASKALLLAAVSIGSVPAIAALTVTARAEGTAQADLGVTVAASPNPAPFGSDVTYTAVAVNHGPGTATHVQVNNVFPGTFRSATTTSGRCFPPKGNYVGCNVPSLAPGTSMTVTLVAHPAGVGQTTYVTSVQGAETDPNLSNQKVVLLGTVNPSGHDPPINVTAGIGGWGTAPPFQTSRAFFVTWSAIDPQTGTLDIDSYDIRFRTATLGSELGSYVVLSRQVGSTWGASFPGSPGYTYCFSVRALALGGITSAWSKEACTAVPVPARAVSRGAGCSLGASPDGYLGQVATCAGPSGFLRLTGVGGRRLGVLVEHCSRCGSALVLLNGRQLRRILLSGPSRGLEVVSVASSGPFSRATIVVQPATRRPIRIGGIGISAA